MGYGLLLGVLDSLVFLVEGLWMYCMVWVNGFVLYVVELGLGFFVFLLYGFLQFWWVWHQQFVDFVDVGFWVVAVDLCGYGGSDKLFCGYDILMFVVDMAQLVIVFGYCDVMVVGNDVGGLFVWMMVVCYLCVVCSLVIFGMVYLLWMWVVIVCSSEQCWVLSYLLCMYQILCRLEYLFICDLYYVWFLFDWWMGLCWRGILGYVVDVECYVEAMCIYFVAYCVLEYFWWLVCFQVCFDGWCFVVALRCMVVVLVLQLHGDFDMCVLFLMVQGFGQYVVGEYEWWVFDGVGYFLYNEVFERISSEFIYWVKMHQCNFVL